jgi:hypothetical protein
MKRPALKRLLAGVAVLGATSLLSGCYVSPDYSYVRGNGYAGAAYYGQGPTVVYRGYDAYPYPYYYGCCWAPGVTVGGVWYGGHRYYRGHDWHRDGRWHGRSGSWHGHGGGHGGSWHGGDRHRHGH